MKPNILFYCGWGGLGHVARAYSIIKALPRAGKYSVASAERWPFPIPAKNFQYINLPEPKSRIRFEGEDIITQNYVPEAEDREGYKKHLHAFFRAAEEINPRLVVIDNPAEVSIISKIFGYKTVVLYESLKTKDLRWRLAWKNVDGVLAPYPKEFMEKARFPYMNNTFCSGGITRYDGEKIVSQSEAKKKVMFDPEKKHMLVTVGKGRMSEDILESVCKCAKNTEYKVVVMYPQKDKFISLLKNSFPEIDVVFGVFEGMDVYLSAADMIVTGAGYGSIMEACLFQKPIIAVPLERIYGEQKMKADILSSMGAITVIDPSQISSENLEKAIKKATKNHKKAGVIQKRVASGEGSKKAAQFLINLIT